MAEVIAVPDESRLLPTAFDKSPTDPTQTPTMNASVTAYSTAVGPSSSLRKLRIASKNTRMIARWRFGVSMAAVAETHESLSLNGSLVRERRLNGKSGFLRGSRKTIRGRGADWSGFNGDVIKMGRLPRLDRVYGLCGECVSLAHIPGGG